MYVRAAKRARADIQPHKHINALVQAVAATIPVSIAASALQAAASKTKGMFNIWIDSAGGRGGRVCVRVFACAYACSAALTIYR